MAIVLSLTLFIYISKLKFSFDLKNIPWSRKIHALPIGHVFEINKDKPDCNRKMVTCHQDQDCVDTCGQNFKCINQECFRPQAENNIQCDAKKGGIRVMTTFGEAECICTKSLFYVGSACNEVNPYINSIATISDEFDGRYHETLPEFLKCKDKNTEPVSVGHSIACLSPLLVF